MKTPRKTEDADTVVRAFELPLQHAPVEAWPLVRRCWDEAAMLANWCVQQLARHDVTRTPGMEKLPPYLVPDLYAMVFGRAREKPGRKDKSKVLPVVSKCYDGAEFFAGAAASANSILQKVRAKYLDERLRVIWQRRGQFSRYDSPAPWPVHAAAWHKAWFDESGKPCVRVALPGGQVDLQLRGGPEFGRQMDLFRRVVEGSLPRLELVIRWQRASEGCHRPTVKVGGVPGRVMVKMVAKLPVRERPGDRTLALLTDPNAFWVADLDGRPAWVMNADHFRRGVARHAEHLRILRRMSEDAKAERRITGNRARHQQERLDAQCEKDRRRIKSWVQESAAHLVGFAVRQKVGEVLYLDRDRGFIPRFPWHSLHQQLGEKLKENGIAFYSESGKQTPAFDDSSPEVEPGEGIDIGSTTPQEDDKWLRISRLREQSARKVLKARSRSGSHPVVSAP